MDKKRKACFVCLAVLISLVQMPVLADTLPAYEQTDFTWQETEEGNDEFPVDEQGAYVGEENGIRIRLTEQYFYSQNDTVKTYSLKKDGSTYLSENFQVKEFACKDGTDQILIDSKLVEILQKIRDHFGAPLTITSGYRTVSHNALVGGASKSYHLYGMAADIKVSGHTPREVAEYAERIGVKGIGLYSTWVHVDTRTSKYFWNSEGSTTYEQGTFISKAAKADLNGDGIVDVRDSLMALQAAVGILKLDREQLQLADMDGNGVCTVSDALLILREALNI